MPTVVNKFVNLELSRFAGNKLSEALFVFPCPQKVLMVADGALSFGPAAFGLSEFLSLVQAAGHTVSTAHRSGAAPVSIAGAFNFATAATPVTLANYDQIWLFGFSIAPLTPAEQAVIANFMKAGGGVFATGDHQTLGQGMGANIPRVRGMRNWSGVPMSSPTRLDTVLDPGLDNIKQFNDQANAVPQRTYPVYFSNGGSDFVAGTWAVHPVLRHPSGAVDCMPDHPHESECLAPVPGPGNFAGVEEWPAPAVGVARIAPQVISVSMSAGRFIVSGAPGGGTKPPVKPRSFGGISAYDGDAAKVGRIVCDSTWHHFVNINLNGAGAGADSLGNPFTGLYVGGAATPEYKKIQSYYLATVRWLAPLGRRNCWPFVLTALARFDHEMLEVALPHPHPCPWDPLIEIGQVAELAINRHWGPGAAADVVSGMLDATQTGSPLAQLMKAQQGTVGESEDKGREPTLLPLPLLRRALLGSVVNLLASKLPNDEAALAKMMKSDHDKLAMDLMREGVEGALPALDDYLKRAMKNTTLQAQAITKLR